MSDCKNCKTLRFPVSVWMMGFILLISSCTLIRIEVSDLRDPLPRSVALSENTVLTTWGAIRVSKSDFFPASFRIRSGEKVIYLDPVETDTTEKADYILITHSHPDHFSPSTIRGLVKKETVIFGPESVTKRLSRYGYAVWEVAPGDTVRLDAWSAVAVPAYSFSRVFLWVKAHPAKKYNVGYVLTLNDSLRIYHAGDTERIPEMDILTDIDVALIPIGNDKLTMDAETAAALVNQLRPGLTIPMHYELNKGHLTRFREAVDSTLQIETLR